MCQYATIAKLFGYTLAPRPPDAVELAVDSTSYGISKLVTGKWYRFPSAEDLGGLELNRMRRAVCSSLSSMSDPDNALILVLAGSKAISMTQKGVGVNQIPSPTSSKWKREIVSGASLYFEDMLQPRSIDGLGYLNTFVNKEDFVPPVYNPFVPPSLYPNRNLNTMQVSPVSKKYNTAPFVGDPGEIWTVLTTKTSSMPLPRSPPETNCRCAFVLQLLSSRPTTASAEQASNGALWKLTFEAAATDLAELGAPGALAYELRFNRYGLRISFLGLSKTIPSYARRLIQLLVKHQQKLLKGNKTLSKSIISAALVEANRARDLSPSRKRIILNSLQKASAYDAAIEGFAFLNSCRGAVCFSEGDLTSSETESLLYDLRDILKDYISNINENTENEKLPAIPSVDDLVDSPNWKPRNASLCYVAGISLLSDACGRVLR
mmetsp:Transcript_6686/g.9635  ORF Transcript_6686/g.9635 Transcript_6686/m.9635 type:complete len:435 (-) Transcript_6686:69-1373(-)